ncbi:MAG: TetR/AcrR family transcriptional regulator [Saprospiraceae bacterium]|nr:TetR/AcrR family transcriptional regulator [Saprospiraceae bacterium]MCB9318142.1 TetR/AcrR family transcriptional regulator [Lewinellaceae bacterium]
MDKTKEIIQAAIHLTSQYGLEGASSAKIAQEANVTPSVLGGYFPTHWHLLEAAYQSVQTDHMHALKKVLRDHKDDFSEAALRSLYLASTQFWLAHEAAFDFAQQYFNSSHFTEEVKAKTDALFSDLVHWFDQAMRKGLVREIAVQQLLPLLFANIVTTVRCIMETEVLVEKDHYNHAGYQFIWHALRL